jgi:hypothetical protein
MKQATVSISARMSQKNYVSAAGVVGAIPLEGFAIALSSSNKKFHHPANAAQ